MQQRAASALNEMDVRVFKGAIVQLFKDIFDRKVEVSDSLTVW
jgi:hypothetical protein